MSTVTKDSAAKMRRLLQRCGFQKLSDFTDHEHFGNELEVYKFGSMKIRLVKDRDRWSIEVGPANILEDWYTIAAALSVATGETQTQDTSDAEVLLGKLFENFPKVYALFSNYRTNAVALKTTERKRSTALMEKIFPGFSLQPRQRGMTKTDLIKAVQEQLGSETSKTEAERAVTAVINAVKVGVKKDKIVQLVGFGTLKVVERKARKGVNPKTLQQIRIPKSKTVKFVPGKRLKSEV